MLDLCFPQFEHPGKIRLGDGILLCSLIEHYGDVNLKFAHKAPGPCVFEEMLPMFNHKFNLNIEYGDYNPDNKYPVMYALEENIRISKPRFVKKFKHRGRFNTSQLQARNVNRSAPEELASKHSSGLPTMELSGNRDSLKILFGKVAAATTHLGVDSGCTWVAIAVKTPVKLMLTSDDKFAHPLHLELARMHQELMLRHDEIKIVENNI